MAWFDPMAIAPHARAGSACAPRRRPASSKGVDPEVIDLAAARFCRAGGRHLRRHRRAGRGRRAGRPARPVAGAGAHRRGSTRSSAPTSTPADIRRLLEPDRLRRAPPRRDERPRRRRPVVAATTPRPRSTSSRRSPATTATATSRAGELAGARAGGLTTRQQDRRVVRRLLVGPRARPRPAAAVPRPGRPRALRARPATASTLANPLVAEESVLRTVAAARAARRRAPTTPPAARPASRCSRSATSSGRRRPASCCPTSASTLGGAARRPRGPGRGRGVAACSPSCCGSSSRPWSTRRVAGPAPHPRRRRRLVAGHVGRRGRRDRPGRARRLRHRRAGGLARGRPRRAARRPSPATPPTARSAATRRATSTSPSRCPTTCRPSTSSAPSPPPASSSGRSGCSTSTAARGSPTAARSLAYRLRLQAADRTLTDDEVAEVRERCVRRVEARHRARLRT